MGRLSQGEAALAREIQKGFCQEESLVADVLQDFVFQYQRIIQTISDSFYQKAGGNSQIRTAFDLQRLL